MPLPTYPGNSHLLASLDAWLIGRRYLPSYLPTYLWLRLIQHPRQNRLSENTDSACMFSHWRPPADSLNRKHKSSPQFLAGRILWLFLPQKYHKGVWVRTDSYLSMRSRGKGGSGQISSKNANPRVTEKFPNPRVSDKNWFFDDFRTPSLKYACPYFQIDDECLPTSFAGSRACLFPTYL